MRIKESIKNLIGYKSSLFTKILVPTIIVLLFQVVLISLVLAANGTIASLEKSATNSLFRNAENRSITLENMMVHTWSNLDKLEGDVTALVSEHGAGDTPFSLREEKQALLDSISDSLLYTLRTTSTTGVFMFFIDEASDDKAEMLGLYYRDFNPSMTPTDYSDILLEKGPAAIARRHSIPLSSLWSELYTIDADYPATFESIALPYQAAIKNPELGSKDLALWGDAHYLDPHSKLDSNTCITYTRPLIMNGTPIGVIGVEVQLEHLKKYFPSNDLGDMGGYMLLRYNEGEESSSYNCTVGAATGSYIKRLGDYGSRVSLTRTQDIHIYTTPTDIFVPTTAALQSLKLYSSNAPFSDRQWGLAALLPDSVLFENSKKISNGIFSSSLIALGLGCILLVFAIRMATKPLLSIASQIKNAPSEDLVINNTNTYEVNLLCDTINEMKRKGRDIENALREEGERYMLALESAIDTFIEYDLVNDRFRIYFFIEENQKQVLSSKTFPNFIKDARIDDICHPADIREFEAVLCGGRIEICEMRLKTTLFPDDSSARKDSDYYWFSFHAVQIRGESKTLEKTIGSATNITEEKLREFAKLEASRRDITTGVYNRDYGELLLSNHLQNPLAKAGDACLVAIAIDRFEDFKAYYGRIFSAALLREIGHELLALKPLLKHVIRWSNAEFIAILSKRDVDAFLSALEAISLRVYHGENAELTLSLHSGLVVCGANFNIDSGLKQAFTALYTAKSTGKPSLVYEDSMQLTLGSALMRMDDTPIEFDIKKESIVGFTFSLFEQTNDIKSAMRMLIKILGELFNLDQVVVCEYDQDFGTNRMINQWTSGIIPAYSSELNHIDHSDFENFTGLLNEMGILLFNAATARDYSTGARQLLCLGQEETSFCALCCAMYDGSAHTGRIMFISADENRWLSETEIFSLYEVTKIICTRLNLEKSNSASRAKSEFLSKMSHEIRTPMNAIIGLTRIAKESEKNPSQVKNCLDKIDSSAKHLLSLINDVLDMSRIESGKLRIEKRSFSLSGLVSYIDTLMRPQFDEKGLAFIVTSEIPQAFVSGDEQKLRQVLINLIGNALKFTPAGGTVTLEVSQQLLPGRAACLCRFKVSDTGVGIGKDEQNHIFDAFEQSAAANAAAGNPQGTGLGLAISNSFISAMGSRIELNSAAGEGSEFSFAVEIQCDSAASEGTAASKPAALPADLFKGKRALVVDDNDINLEIAAFILEDIGFSCEIAKDGREAVDQFLSSAPGYYDVIFMDISMPVMDGLTATREIRKRIDRSDARSLPIIAMTANAFSEDTKKSIDAGMNAHVAKPIDVDFLYQTLQNLFSPGK